MKTRFKDRREAGKLLANSMAEYRGQRNAVVLGMPRGGVILAEELATSLQLPLDVCIVRKLGVPGQPELAMGAIGAGGVMVLNEELIQAYGITPEEVRHECAKERIVLENRLHLYRKDMAPVEVSGKTAILVDDGIATGMTVEAALESVRRLKPARLLLATGVASIQALNRLAPKVDEIFCAQASDRLQSVGEWYENFAQVDDNEVVQILSRNAERRTHASQGNHAD